MTDFNATITRLKVIKATSAEWTSHNPVLSRDEVGFDTTTGHFKLGDNSSPYNDLRTFTGSRGEKGETGEKGEAGGSVSQPPVGHYKVTNIYVNKNTGKFEVEYEVPNGG